MAVDTPAKIAVLGAGPIGLEAALYARFLGYDVDVYEQGSVGEHIRDWGHVRMFSSFRMNRSPLSLAALRAQNKNGSLPEDDAYLTGQEYVDRFLQPLANCDLLSNCVQTHTRVLAVGREDCLKGDSSGQEERGDEEFRLLLHSIDGTEHYAQADVVIDASGTFSQPNSLGQGGLPALGERQLHEVIEYHLPDVLGSQRQQYAGKAVLVVGCGYSAATTVVALAELMEAEPETKLHWVTRRDRPEPLVPIENDPLPARAELTRRANEVAQSPRCSHWAGCWVHEIHHDAKTQQFTVTLHGQQEATLQVDRLVALVGYQPNVHLYRELQVHQCYASEGPMKLAAALLKSAGGDCLTQTSQGPDTLINPEPHFYILGAKSYGRRSDFLLSVGFQQIQELFTIIGDREELNLYQSMGEGALP